MVNTPSEIGFDNTLFPSGFENCPALNPDGSVTSIAPGYWSYMNTFPYVWFENGKSVGDAEFWEYAQMFVMDMFYMMFCAKNDVKVPPMWIGSGAGEMDLTSGVPTTGFA